MIISDDDLKMLSRKLSSMSAAHAERDNTQTFSEAVAASAKNADGKRLELLRSIRAMARRLGVELPEDRKIDPTWLNKLLVGEDISARLSFKSALHSAGLLA
jgi:hypothetical protein